MKKVKKTGAYLVATLLAVLLLLNTVSAGEDVDPGGPPIGTATMTVIPETYTPGENIQIDLQWTITDAGYLFYNGPFHVKIKVEDQDGNEIWALGDPGDPGKIVPAGSNYTVDILIPDTVVGPLYISYQIVALELFRTVGDQERMRLVASGSGSVEVPEFSTIALPALSIVGLYVFFNHRKRKQG